MNIFFDVDHTILGLDDTLRPGTRETFEKLIEDGHKIYIWSGMGERWEVVRKHKLEGFASGVFEKPASPLRGAPRGIGVSMTPDFVIDDYPEVVAVFGGVWVPPYYFKRNADQQMDRVYEIITEYVQNGDSADVQYRAKGSKVPLFYNLS